MVKMKRVSVETDRAGPHLRSSLDGRGSPRKIAFVRRAPRLELHDLQATTNGPMWYPVSASGLT
jgi:hypothetical protein